MLSRQAGTHREARLVVQGTIAQENAATAVIEQQLAVMVVDGMVFKARTRFRVGPSGNARLWQPQVMHRVAFCRTGLGHAWPTFLRSEWLGYL